MKRKTKLIRKINIELCKTFLYFYILYLKIFSVHKSSQLSY